MAPNILLQCSKIENHKKEGHQKILSLRPVCLALKSGVLTTFHLRWDTFYHCYSTYIQCLRIWVTGLNRKWLFQHRWKNLFNSDVYVKWPLFDSCNLPNELRSSGLTRRPYQWGQNEENSQGLTLLNRLITSTHGQWSWMGVDKHEGSLWCGLLQADGTDALDCQSSLLLLPPVEWHQWVPPHCAFWCLLLLCAGS